MAICGSRTPAPAEQIFCSPAIEYVRPVTPNAASDTRYSVGLDMRGAGDNTFAELAIMDDTRQYNAHVALPRNANARRLTLHFSKSIAIRAMWIEAVGNYKNRTTACIADPTLATVAREYAPDVAVRTMVEVPAQRGVPLPIRADCVVRDKDVLVLNPVTPEYPEDAKQAALGEVTALIAVHVKADGRVGNVFVRRSSGNSSIDRAAISAAMKSSYSPRIINCMPFAGYYLFRATFDPNS